MSRSVSVDGSNEGDGSDFAMARKRFAFGHKTHRNKFSQSECRKGTTNDENRSLCALAQYSKASNLRKNLTQASKLCSHQQTSQPNKQQQKKRCRSFIGRFIMTF